MKVNAVTVRFLDKDKEDVDIDTEDFSMIDIEIKEGMFYLKTKETLKSSEEVLVIPISTIDEINMTPGGI